MLFKTVGFAQSTHSKPSSARDRGSVSLGKMENLEEAITSHHKALSLRPLGHPERSMSLNKLANSVLTRYERLGRMEDLEEAIAYNREALALRPLGHPDRSVSLNNLACAVRTRYEQLGRMEDLEEAISYNCEALTLHPLGHPYRSMFLNNLANSVLIRYEQLGRMEDLEETISYYHEALTLCSLGHPHRSMSLNNLANSVLTRYEWLGRMEDLEEAIAYNHEALALCPLGHPDRSMSLNNLANTVLTRYEQLGRMEDLEETISYYRKALTLCPLGRPDRSGPLNNLANAVLTRYKQLGRMEDLEEAISYHREALTLRPLGHPGRSRSLNSLANAVLTRYEQLGRMEDLEEAISYHREALSLRPLGHPDRSRSLNSLANSVLTRYEQMGRMEDLEEAISTHRKALTLRPLGHPDRSMTLINLANAVHTHYKQLGRMKDLEEAISYNYEALILRPLGHPGRSMSLNNLANAVRTRYEQLGRMEDLEEAISYHREALTLYPLGHPDRSMSLNNLANAVVTRYKQLSRMEDLGESFGLFTQAVHDLVASPKQRLHAAIQWAYAAQRHHHSSVIRAYTMSLHLLNRCLIAYPNVESQQKFLATANIPRSLATDAASAAIGAKDLGAAVELLDLGRAILWSKMAGYRYPLDRLRQVHRQLADDLEMLNGQLERLALSSGSGLMDDEKPMSQAHLEARMKKYRILSEEWDKVVEQIRKIEGFSNFLQAVPFATLQTAAAEGPVILINVSKYRSDAIVLHIDKPPILVPLPDVTPKQLIHLVEELALARDPGSVTNPSKRILPILRDLWKNVVSPVHDCLTQLAVPQNSRIWWCPTSELCALPLHAAGPYQPRRRNLTDIYISSYIPTISTLISARSNMIEQSNVPKLLLIGQPGDGLANVQDEIDNVGQLLSDFGVGVTVIAGADASRETILRGLQQHSWTHFACHGHLGGKGEPFHASFQLHGGSRLTLLELIQARLPNAELAFLSACHSAAGDASTPDETIHLAAALQFCGFRSVVGTLWAMEDRDGPTISKAFYEYMFREPGRKADFRDSAEALNLAIRAMRRNGLPLDRWIMFVHIGA